MTNTAYVEEQIQRIDKAIRLAERTRDLSLELRRFSQESAKDVDVKGDDFAEDTLKYFDTSFSQGQIERLRLNLNDLKKKLIEIKIKNDELLFEGGFLLCIDQKIDDIFLSNTLCLMKPSDAKALAVMDDTIAKLKELRGMLGEAAV
ncbi:MAG: hypothetical protein E7236_06015 [Lachnospiraceae bacterium]|nr:hypothetical protein [Lachnospiraceae bacterium]